MKPYAIAYTHNGKQSTVYIDAEGPESARERLRAAYFQDNEPMQVKARIGTYW